MRLLFTVHSAPTHLHVLCPIIAAARQAGHEVTVGGVAELAPMLQAAGLGDVKHIVAGRDWMSRVVPEDFSSLRTLQDFRQAFPDMLALMGGEPAAEAAEELVWQLKAEGWVPDIIVREYMEFSGYLAAALLGIPLVTIGVGSIAAHSFPPEVVASITAQSRQKLGLGPSDGRDAYQFFVSELPPGFDPLMKRLPNVHYYHNDTILQSNEPHGPPFTLPHKQPFIVASLGSASTNEPRLAKMSQRLMQTTIDALAELDCTVLMSVGDANLEHFTAPPHIHLKNRINQRAILPHSQLFIGQGGLSSVLETIAAAVPQVLLPVLGDTLHTSELAQRAGMAEYIAFNSVDELTPAHIRKACEKVLTNNSYQQAVARVRSQSRQQPNLNHLIVDLGKLSSP